MNFDTALSPAASSSQPSPSSLATKSDLWTAIKRGLAGRCPVCGQGKLFRSYLKLSDHCSHCHAPLGTIRADDGPAWATILVVGHLIVPFFIVVARTNAPEWIYLVVLLPITTLLTLLLLPRMNGLFAAVLWSLGMPSGVPQATTTSPMP